MANDATISRPTLIKALVRERRLTVQETLRVLERRAQAMDERAFALSERQLRRWLAGDLSSFDGARAANSRVAEAEFGWPIEDLLARDHRSSDVRPATPELAGSAEDQLVELVAWVVEHSALSFESAYAILDEATEQLRPSSPAAARAGRARARSGAARAEVAAALVAYYGEPSAFYCARIGEELLSLSVVGLEQHSTGLGVPLGAGAESCRLDWRAEQRLRLDEVQAGAALARVAAATASGQVIVNDALYRLLAIEIGTGHLVADFASTEFAAYALTADLLEAELREQLAAGQSGVKWEAGALRDAWLPTIESARRLDGRVCVGGPVCLVAVADGDHYHLLVQERSSRVLNATGALAVIPKAFHQPTVDLSGETRLSATLLREVEEELLGRSDLDRLTPGSSRRADPVHPSNASAPMAWLQAHPDAWTMECTAFGINMVSGNYEFACLLAINDSRWWSLFGHLVEANWEAMRLHRYSSLDAAGLVHLAGDPRWSNEGLFALLEGLRRLAVLDPGRVAGLGIGPA